VKKLLQHFSVPIGDDYESLCRSLSGLLRAAGLNPGTYPSAEPTGCASYFPKIEAGADLTEAIVLIILRVFALLLYSIILTNNKEATTRSLTPLAQCRYGECPQISTNPRRRLMERLLSRIGRSIRWPYTLVDWLRCWRLLPPLLFAVFIATAPRAFPQNQFYVTIEPPGAESQQSQLAVNGPAYGAAGVFVENFDELTTGLHQKGFSFDGNRSVGSYSPGLIVQADQFGGAGGTGNYFTVNTSLGSPESTILRFVNPQRYFGL
jgi:hypothetical protein